jgi:peroxiredoxin
MKIIRNLFTLVAAIGVFAIAASAQTSLTSLDGSRVDVQNQKGKVVILAIGARWLPLSGKQAQSANALAKKYSGKNVVVYFILTDSTNPKSRNHATDAQLKEWATKNAVTMTVLRDPDGAATLGKFGVDQLPSFVVLDKSGNRSGEPFGGSSQDTDGTAAISQKVDSLL